MQNSSRLWLLCAAVMGSSAEVEAYQSLRVEGSDCPVASTVISGGGVVRVVVTQNDISCCANTGCVGYQHSVGPSPCGIAVRVWSALDEVQVQVGGWSSNIGNEYILDTGPTGAVSARYLDGFCSDNDPIPPWSATIQSATTIAIVPDEAPRPDFDWAPPAPQVGAAVQFTNRSTGPDLQFEWDFDGNGTPDSTAADPSHAFPIPGPQTVGLFVRNPYGSDLVRKVVVVGAPGGPVFTAKHWTFDGFFLDFDDFLVENDLDLSLDWRGTPGSVQFRIDSGPPFAEPASPQMVQHRFNMTQDFSPKRFLPSIVTLTPQNGEGTLGQSWFEPVWVFERPLWLRDADATEPAITFTLAPEEIRADLDWTYPEEPLEGSFEVPEWVPFLSGTIGLLPTDATVRGFVSSRGTGSLALNGRTGWELAGQSIDGSVSGGGSFSLIPPGGLRLTEASFGVNLHGAIHKELGVVQVIPALASLAHRPFFSWFNEAAKLRAEIGADFGAATSFSQDDGGSLQFEEATGTVGLSLRGTLAVDPVEDLASVEAYVAGSGAVTVDFGATAASLMRQADLELTAGVKMTFFLFEDPVEFIRGVHCAWTPGSSVVCTPIEEVEQAALDRLVPVRTDYARFGEYSALAAPRSPHGESSVNPAPLLLEDVVSNVFHGASPALARSSTGERMLLWVHQDLADPVAQSTEIRWSRDTGSGWSAPQTIVDDTRAEFSPRVAIGSDGVFVAAWLRIASPAFSTPISTLDDLPLFARELEVVTSTFTPTAGTWSAPVSLTNDLAYDGDLRLVVSGQGKLMLTWLSNPGGEMVSTSANPSQLRFSLRDEGTGAWSAAITLAAGLAGVVAHATAFRGPDAIVTLARDPDPGVSDDSVIETYLWNGTIWSGPQTLAAGGADHRAPAVVHGGNSGDALVVWTRGDELVWARPSAPTPQTILANSGFLAVHRPQLSANPAGDVVAVWPAVSEAGPGHLDASVFDRASETWSRALPLTSGDESEDSRPDASLGADGRLRIAYLGTDISRTTRIVNVGGQMIVQQNIPVRGATDLRIFERTLARDLRISHDDLTLTPARPRSGETLAVSLRIHNAGDFPVGSFVASLYRGDPASGGVLLQSANVPGPLAAGDEAIAEFSLTYAGGAIVALVDATGIVSEIDEANNKASAHLENLPPIAAAVASVTAGPAPVTVDFDASRTIDPDGDAVDYRWSFDDGSPGAAGLQVSHVFTAPGIYHVALIATDARGGSGTASIKITAGPLPPPPPLTGPPDPSRGRALRVGKAGSNLALQWDTTSCGVAPTYNLYAGTLGGFVRVNQAGCDLGNSGNAVVSLGGAAVWFVVTGANGIAVGSFGDDSADRPRDLEGWGPLCDEHRLDRTVTSAACFLDSDGDAIADDGDHSGVAGDAPCADGVTSSCDDNCRIVFNPNQQDPDGDQRGSACDPCPNDANDDIDGDGVCGDVDNCPTTPNASQVNADGDALGDACDPCPSDASNDVDGDGICGASDNCPQTPNPDQADSNGDGVGDACTVFALITNQVSDDVSVVYVATDTVAPARIPVGDAPKALAVSPVGTRAYVANASSNTLSCIHTPTGTVVGTVNVGASPNGVAVSPDGSRVYVANHVASTLSVIDGPACSFVTSVIVGNQPIGVAVSPDGSRVYVADYGGSVSVVTTSNLSVTTVVLGAGHRPQGLAVTPDGLGVYIASYLNDRVLLLDTQSNTITANIVVGGTRPLGVVVSPDGARVYVTLEFSNRVAVIDTATNQQTASVLVGLRPTGIDVTSDGAKLYVANFGSDTVSVIDTQSLSVTATLPVGSLPVAFGRFITPGP